MRSSCEQLVFSSGLTSPSSFLLHSCELGRESSSPATGALPLPTRSGIRAMFCGLTLRALAAKYSSVRKAETVGLSMQEYRRAGSEALYLIVSEPEDPRSSDLTKAM